MKTFIMSVHHHILMFNVAVKLRRPRGTSVVLAGNGNAQFPLDRFWTYNVIIKVSRGYGFSHPQSAEESAD